MEQPRIRWCCPRSLRRMAPSVLLLVPALALAAGNGKLQIHHIDVGQGDGTLLISPNGQTALFDDGVYTNCTNIKSYLQGQGLTVVDYHFASHYHADHIGCIDDLAAIGITIGTAGYDRGASYSSATFTNYVNTLGAKRTTIAKDQIITLDAGAANPVFLKCVELNGAGVYSPTGSDENAKSVVMLVSYGNFNEVIAGDLTGSASSGNDVETTVGPLVGDVEVYKVHHHGSTYSSNDNWLAATTPEVGVIQTGDGNTYGHPTAGALGRLHAHGVHTYWNETGAGVAPDPAWDKVANGTIVLQADPGPGAAYTVTGPGIADTYFNDGGVPPINETLVASSMTVLKGSISAGDVTRLAANDAVRVSVSAGVSGGQYYTDWYGSVNLNHPPLNLTVTYDGNFTVSRTQTLYLWNWTTGAWVQINSATVGTTDVTKTWSTTSPASYLSGTREVRFRVKGNNRSSSYTSRGDYMAFTYDYQPGTAPSPVVGERVVAASFTPVAGDDREAEALHRLPQSALLRIEAAPGANGVTLSWATGVTDHLDGFNVYRETVDGERVHVGVEALIEVTAEEARFRYVDATASAGVYWLGARGCSGPEGLIGPFRVDPARGGSIAFAATPNPVRGGAARFQLALERETAVRLDIFDLGGRRIATPQNGRLAAGDATIEWSLRATDGAAVEPGVYFARLEALGRTLFTRVTVLGD